MENNWASEVQPSGEREAKKMFVASVAKNPNEKQLSCHGSLHNK